MSLCAKTLIECSSLNTTTSWKRMKLLNLQVGPIQQWSWDFICINIACTWPTVTLYLWYTNFQPLSYAIALESLRKKRDLRSKQCNQAADGRRTNYVRPPISTQALDILNICMHAYTSNLNQSHIQMRCIPLNVCDSRSKMNQGK